ncbi:MAG: hypothetical protein RR324_06495 [Cellulosilyticaceae bacterium]
MKILKNKWAKKYQIRLITYAVTTLTLGTIGIYTFTNFMEQYNRTGRIGKALEEGYAITQAEAMKLIQSFPRRAREYVLEAVQDGMTEEEIKEVYAYYKEYSNIEDKSE